jgi:hypothetical protein
MTDDTRDVHERISELEETGANVLVRGTCGPEETNAVCTDLLGDPNGDRYRIVALVGNGGKSALDRLPDGAEEEPRHLRIVDYAATARSVADPEDVFGADLGDVSRPTSGVYTHVESGLDEFGVALSEEATGLVGPFETLAPGSLRLCVDSLRPLVVDHDVEELYTFLHLLTSFVKRHRGIAHYHLPSSVDDAAVRPLADLFDATIEVELVNDALRQRWTVDGEATDWLPVRC